MQCRLARVVLVVWTSLTFAAVPSWAGHTTNGAAGSGFPVHQSRRCRQRLCKRHRRVGKQRTQGGLYVDGVGPKRIGGFYACMAAVEKAGYQVVRG